MIPSRSTTFPLPSSQGFEVDFLQNRPSPFQRQASDCIFQPDKQQFAPRTKANLFKDTVFGDTSNASNQKQLKHTQDSLQAAIRALKSNKSKNDAMIATFDICEAGSWTDVIAAVKEAEEKYLRDDSPTEKIRKAFRKVEDNSKSIQPFLGMLPDGEYKILCGGLTLILKGMMKKAERRERMAELLERLPSVVQDAEQYAHMYPGANNLRSVIEELYIQFVGAIDDMIRWYLEKPLKRGFKSVLANDAYGDKLTKRIVDIDRAQSAFRGETEKLLHWRTQLIGRNGIVTGMMTQQMSIDLKEMDSRLSEVQEGQRTVIQGIEVVGSKVVNSVSSVLQDLQKNAKWFQERENEYKQKVGSQAARIRELEEQLQKKVFRTHTLARRLHLSLPADGHVTDVDLALATGIGQRVRYQTRSKYITETKDFRQWFTAKESGILCLSGNSEQDPLSPTAFLAALLVQNIKPNVEDILVLPFFCGLHTNVLEVNQHNVSGPILLLRTLLAQLLSVDNLDTKQYLASIDEDDVQALECMRTKAYLHSLRELLLHLVQDYKSVFIIIDGIEYYDKQEYRVRLQRVLEFLVKMTQKVPSDEGTLKVLVMAASHSSILHQSEVFNAIDIPEEIEGDGEEYESFGEM